MGSTAHCIHECCRQLLGSPLVHVAGNFAGKNSPLVHFAGNFAGKNSPLVHVAGKSKESFRAPVRLFMLPATPFSGRPIAHSLSLAKAALRAKRHFVQRGPSDPILKESYGQGFLAR